MGTSSDMVAAAGELEHTSVVQQQLAMVAGLDGIADAVDLAKELLRVEWVQGIEAVLVVEFHDRCGTVGMKEPRETVDGESLVGMEETFGWGQELAAVVL